MLWRVGNEWQREIREALKPHDLTHAQFVLMASTIWLEDHGHEVNQAALSKQAVMDKMMVSDVIRGLGLVRVAAEDAEVCTRRIRVGQ